MVGRSQGSGCCPTLTSAPFRSGPPSSQTRATVAATSSGSYGRPPGRSAASGSDESSPYSATGRIEHRGARRVGRHRDGVHAGAGQVGGQAAHQAEDRVLDGGVRREVEEPLAGGGRGDGDEPAAGRVRPAQQVRYDGGRGVPDAEHVGPPEGVEVGRRRLPERAPAGDHGRRGDADVEPTEGVDGVPRGGPHRVRVADVGHEGGDGVARERLQVCARGEGVVDTCQAVGLTEAAVDRDDAQPAVGEGAHGRGADPAGGAGHEGDPVVGQRGTPSVRVKPSGTRMSSRRQVVDRGVAESRAARSRCRRAGCRARSRRRPGRWRRAPTGRRDRSGPPSRRGRAP